MIQLKNILLEKITKNLRLGSRGDQVKELQKILISAGYLDAKKKNGKPSDDGNFGKRTDAALKKWQRKMDLVGDGVVGPLTRNKLSTIDSSNTSRVDVTPPVASSNTKVKKFGAAVGYDKNNLKQITKTEIPFTNREQGNHFRIFVNNQHPAIAKKLDLAKIGLHDNTTILNALNTIVDGKTLLIKYNEYKVVPKNWESLVTAYNQLYKTGDKTTGANTWTADKLSDEAMKTAIERYNIPNNLNSKRISDQLAYIKMRNANESLGFFLVDPRLNLVFAFNKDYKLVDYSHSIAGSDPQTSKIFTRDDWMKLCGFKIDVNAPENRRYYKVIGGKQYYHDGQYTVAADGKPIKDTRIINQMQVNYDVLEQAKKRYQAAGIYTIGDVYFSAGYSAQKDNAGNVIKTPNVYGLSTLDGQSLGTAIHSIFDEPRRWVADKELRSYLQKDLTAGNIPDRYINAVEFAMGTNKYDMSSGCFNVSPKFIQNPKVAEVITGGSRVFIMSESPEDYLVRVDQGKEAEYFNKLNGEGGQCVNPNSLTATYGDYLV